MTALRRAAIPVALLAAALLAGGCPALPAKYNYDRTPTNTRRIGQRQFVPAGEDPIEIDVAADQEWQDTGVFLHEGEAVYVTAEGKWNPDVYSGNRDCGPDGYSAPSGYYVPELRALRYGALIGRVGRGRPFLVGSRCRVVALADGPLQMTCNRSLRSTILGRGEMFVKIRTGTARR
jgi:hypothetical protein